ncbi:MAG TPA: DUF433 domain-containing protein [Longimicrobium sp.]|jgi:uncharacterized protein (DUF433 family)
MNWREHIVADPAILSGKPAVRGTRLGVDFLLNLFASGWSVDQVLMNYPGLSLEALQAVFAYERERDRSICPPS